MLKLSRLTDYAVAAMVRLGSSGGAETSPNIAARIGVPEPTVAKVLKALAARGLITSRRGIKGGYRLDRPLSAISVAEVIVAIDGPIALVSCVEGVGVGCENQLCPLIGRWDPVNQAINAALSAITLADMAASAPSDDSALIDPAIIDIDAPASTEETLTKFDEVI